MQAQLFVNNSNFFIDSNATFFVKQQDVIANYNLKGKGTLYINGTVAQQINMNGNTIPNLKVDNMVNANIASTCQLGTLTLQPSSLVTVNNQHLQISSAIINNNGIIDITNGLLELNGTSAQYIYGSTFKNKTIKNLKLSNNSNITLNGLNDSLKISGVLNFGASNVTFNSNDNLTMLSSASGTSCVADMTSNGTWSGNKILGNVTVERYIPNHPKAWQFLAAPTSGQTIRQTWQERATTPNENLHPGYGTQITSNISGATGLGFDVYSPGGPSMKTYNSINNSWEGITSTNNNITNTKGYMIFVRGDRSVISVGQNSTATVMRTTGTLFQEIGNPPAIINVPFGKIESVGNPYAAAIDFSKTIKTGGLQDLFYLWDPKLTTGPNSANGFGGYQTFTANGNGTYHITPGSGSFLLNDITGLIQSGAAFFVSASGSNGTLQFAENNKVESSAITTRVLNGTAERLEIKLSSVDSNVLVLLDGIMVDFDSSFSNTIDEMDALKISTTAENLAIQLQDKNLVVERRNNLKIGDTLFFILNHLKQKTYQLDFSPILVNTYGLEAILFDRYLGVNTPIDLMNVSHFNFSVNIDTGSYASDRFFLTFKQSLVLPVKILNVEALRNDDNTATVKWNTENENILDRYVIERSDDGSSFFEVGKQIPMNISNVAYKYHFIDANAKITTNYYRVKAISIDGQIHYTKIVKVEAKNRNFSYRFYPNPATNNKIHIRITNGLPGNYDLGVYSTEGKLILTEHFYVSVSHHELKIILSKSIANGKYILKMTTPKGLIYTEAILVKNYTKK